MNNQFNNRIVNISIVQNNSYVVASIKVMSFLGNNSVVIGHSSSICLTDKTFCTNACHFL